MKPKILHPDSADELFTEELCHITELSNSSGDEEVSVARCRVEPGVTTRLHRLTVAERYLIEGGAGLMELAELPPEPVGPGDVVLIPPGCPQRITNTGEVDLVFLAVCTPRFEPAAYEDIDDGD